MMKSKRKKIQTARPLAGFSVAAFRGALLPLLGVAPQQVVEQSQGVRQEGVTSCFANPTDRAKTYSYRSYDSEGGKARRGFPSSATKKFLEPQNFLGANFKTSDVTPLIKKRPKIYGGVRRGGTPPSAGSFTSIPEVPPRGLEVHKSVASGKNVLILKNKFKGCSCTSNSGGIINGAFLGPANLLRGICGVNRATKKVAPQVPHYSLYARAALTNIISLAPEGKGWNPRTLPCFASTAATPKLSGLPCFASPLPFVPLLAALTPLLAAPRHGVRHGTYLNESSGWGRSPLARPGLGSPSACCNFYWLKQVFVALLRKSLALCPPPCRSNPPPCRSAARGKALARVWGRNYF